MYGKRSYGKRTGYRTGRRIGGYRRANRLSVARKKFTPRGTIARRLNRKELKICDDYYSIAHWKAMGHDASGSRTMGWVNWVLGGMINKVASTMGVQFGNPPTTAGLVPMERMVPNCISNIDNGTTATTRIGNVVAPRSITLRGVVEACKTTGWADAEATVNQRMNVSPGELTFRYIRTSVRIYIIRDKHMNDKGYVEFNDVFQNSTSGIAEQNPFLWNRKIDTLGRYEIIKTLSFELDQDDPQKAFACVVPLKGIPIRYNGAATAKLVGVNVPVPLMTTSSVDIPNSAVNGILQLSNDLQSMTNGIYILGVTHTSNTNYVDTNDIMTPSITWSSRLTFYDA